MASSDHRPLSEHSMTTLTKIEVLVEELLGKKSALPQDLFTKLDTYHADLAAAIEDMTAAAGKVTPLRTWERMLPEEPCRRRAGRRPTRKARRKSADANQPCR
jgi:hypothetical protein